MQGCNPHREEQMSRNSSSNPCSLQVMERPSERSLSRAMKFIAIYGNASCISIDDADGHRSLHTGLMCKRRRSPVTTPSPLAEQCNRLVRGGRDNKSCKRKERDSEASVQG